MTDAPVAEGRRRILYVQRPAGGGSATGLHDMIRALDTRLYEPVVLLYQPSDYSEAYRRLGASVLELGEIPPAGPVPRSLGRALSGLRRYGTFRKLRRLVLTEWPVAPRIARLIRRERIDLVHHNDNPRGDRVSILAARLAGVPQVCHVRFLAEYVRPIDRRLLAWVDYFIYMSRAIQEQFREAIGMPAERGELVYDPFDVSGLAGAASRAGRVRAELGLADDERVVSSVGRLVPWKGHDVFLRAMADVIRSHPRVRALIVGAPPRTAAGAQYLAWLRQTAFELGLSERVIFTGFRSDVADIMAASDVVVHSASQPEPFGRVVVEAMAIGRPVVATAAGGVPEIVDHERTGLLVPLGDERKSAQAIDALLRDPALAKLMGERAKRAVVERFGLPPFAAALHRIYGSVLNGARQNGTS